MNYHAAHVKLFDTDGNTVQGAIAALRRPLPSFLEYPDAAAREYAEISIRALNVTWPSFMVQGLRLLLLEKIFRARGLFMPPDMDMRLLQIKASPEIQETLLRAGVSI